MTSTKEDQVTKARLLREGDRLILAFNKTATVRSVTHGPRLTTIQFKEPYSDQRFQHDDTVRAFLVERAS